LAYVFFKEATYILFEMKSIKFKLSKENKSCKVTHYDSRTRNVYLITSSFPRTNSAHSTSYFIVIMKKIVFFRTIVQK
jgi:hypothetical protein